MQRDDCWYSAPIILCGQSKTIAHVMVLLLFRVGFLYVSINLIQVTPHRYTQKVNVVWITHHRYAQRLVS